MKQDNTKKGFAGQQAAEDYLTANGYTLIARNFRTRSAEIDLIMRHGGYIVFVEVKYRLGTGYGAPAEAVDYRKRKKIIGCSLAYISKNRLTEQDFRYDVTEVLAVKGKVSINHIENAFGVE